MKILNRHNGSTIFEAEAASIEQAVKQGVSLVYANLSDANLYGANITEAKMPNKPITLPSKGEAIIGYKKLEHGVMIKVEVPQDADRVSTWKNRKCRASALKVLEVVSNPKRIPTDCMPGKHDPSFIYQLGEIHVPENGFNPDERHDCLPGLHFFMTEEEAMEW